jgi:hypothetical protein
VIWDCPNCKTENRDLSNETSAPVCERCDIDFEWCDLNVDNLALFELDGNGESTGTVLHFCSESCRQAANRKLDNNYVFGRSDGALDDEQCSHCGGSL